jgi:RNA polymerase sigma-70 factor (ECF subfamily)
VTSPRPADVLGDREREEREWLDLMRAGDERGFEFIFRRYIGPLCEFADSYVASRDEAEEIVQSLFAWIWGQRESVETPRGVRSYLYAAVRNRALNVLRSRRLGHALHDRLMRDSAGRRDIEMPLAAESELDAADLNDALGRAVREMPPRCREVFALLRDRHLTYAEAAEVLAISAKTVEIHMGRALAILRTRLAFWLEG